MAKKNKEHSNPTVRQVLKDFETSWEYTNSSWHSRWDDNYKLYNNERVNRAYDGITDTFIPMTFSTIESMTSALFGSKPRFDFIPPASNKDQETDILNALVDSYWDKDKWSIKIINWGRDMLRFGTSVIYVVWENDHPSIVNVPIRDFFIDPTANSLENAQYMGRRYLTTKEELKSFEIVDLDKSTENDTVYKKKYKNLGRIRGASTAQEKTDKQEKDMFYGSTLNEPQEDQVEVIEYWTEDRVVSIANRDVVIEDEENYYKAKAREDGDEFPKGLMPFAALRDYVDGSLFYAKGEIDFLADQQELLNDLTNQNIDAVTFTLNPMYTLDPKYADKIEQVENLPGAVYPFEAGTLQPIPMGNVPQDAFNERLNIKSEMRETSASNEIVKGVGQEGGKITATEINAQIAGAGQRIALKITQIEDEGFYRLAKIILHMVRLYVKDKQEVRVVANDGVEWKEYDPELFKEGEYEPRVQLETTVEARKAQDAEMAKEMLAAYLGDPDINQKELKKLSLMKGFDLDPDEVQKLTTLEELPEAPMTEMPPELPPEAIIPQEPMVDPLMAEQPMGDFIVDPVTGEIYPAEPTAMPEGAI